MAPYKPRVLLLESDPELRTLLRSFFEDHELSVDYACDVDEATVLLAARPYELVLFGIADDDEAVRLATAVGRARGRTALIRIGSSAGRRHDVHMVIDPLRAVRHLRALVQSARDLLARPAVVTETLRIA